MEASAILRAVAALLRTKGAAMLQDLPTQDPARQALREGDAIALGMIAAHLVAEALELERLPPLMPAMMVLPARLDLPLEILAMANQSEMPERAPTARTLVVAPRVEATVAGAVMATEDGSAG